ncbi:hypothetical protein Gotur_032573 [Gossypium turneri]
MGIVFYADGRGFECAEAYHPPIYGLEKDDSSELVDAANKGNGNAMRKKEETHRMAEANKAFAYFR